MESRTYVSLREARLRFKLAIDKPDSVWDSFADIPDLIVIVEEHQAREKEAIRRMKEDGIDYKKYFSPSKPIDSPDLSCYPTFDECTKILGYGGRKTPAKDSDSAWKKVSVERFGGRICLKRRRVDKERVI